MLVAALKPKALPGTDDQYLKIVNQFGDTTSNAAQIQALEAWASRPASKPTPIFPPWKSKLIEAFQLPAASFTRGPWKPHLGTVTGCA